LGDPASQPAQLAEPEFLRWVEILRSEPKPYRGLKTRRTKTDQAQHFPRSSQSRPSVDAGCQRQLILPCWGRIHDDLTRPSKGKKRYCLQVLWEQIFDPAPNSAHSGRFDERFRFVTPLTHSRKNATEPTRLFANCATPPTRLKHQIATRPTRLLGDCQFPSVRYVREAGQVSDS
jgi:hypothetical protein